MTCTKNFLLSAFFGTSHKFDTMVPNSIFFFNCNLYFIPLLKNYSVFHIQVAMNNMVHIDYITYNCKHFTCSAIAAKGLRGSKSLGNTVGMGFHFLI